MPDDIYSLKQNYRRDTPRRGSHRGQKKGQPGLLPAWPSSLRLPRQRHYLYTIFCFRSTNTDPEEEPR